MSRRNPMVLTARGEIVAGLSVLLGLVVASTVLAWMLS